MRAALKRYLQGRYGNSSAELQRFGFTPDKVPQRSVAAKTQGLAKAKATRTARHTQGKKQKSTIKGTVPVTVPATGGPSASSAASTSPPATKPASAPVT